MVGYWSISKKTKKDYTNPSLLNKQPFPAKKGFVTWPKEKLFLFE